MNRAAFLAGSGAAALAGTLGSPGAFAAALRDTMTQGELFAALPAGRAGAWTRVILGSGANYRKQIGLGCEADPASVRGARLYVETQVAVPGGSWNPLSMRKAYLRDAAFGSLLRPYPVVTNLGRTEHTIYRYGEPATLYLLDEPWLYDARPLHVLSAEPERIRVARAIRDTIHVVANYGTPRSSHGRLERIDLWHAPDVPFGVVRYRATRRDLDPFELRVYAHGDAFATMIPMPLDEVRSLTKEPGFWEGYSSSKPFSLGEGC